MFFKCREYFDGVYARRLILSFGNTVQEYYLFVFRSILYISWQRPYNSATSTFCNYHTLGGR